MVSEIGAHDALPIRESGKRQRLSLWLTGAQGDRSQNEPDDEKQEVEVAMVGEPFAVTEDKNQSKGNP